MTGLEEAQIQAIVDAVNKCCMQISLTERCSISDALHVSQVDLSILGFCVTQLWLSRPDGSLTFLKSDGSTTNSSPQETAKILRDVFSVETGSSLSNEDQGQHINISSGQVNRRDTSWHDLNVLIRSSLSRCLDRGEDGAANTDDVKSSNWKSIYLIPITVDSNAESTISYSNRMGYIIAVEDYSGVSKAMTDRLTHTNQNDLRRTVSLLLYRLLAAAIGNRLVVLEQKEEEKKLSCSSIIASAPSSIDFLSGMLQYYEDMSTASQACDVTRILACTGVLLFKSPICFVLEASSLSATSHFSHSNDESADHLNHSNSSDVTQAVVYSAYSDHTDVTGIRIKSNTSVECKGFIGTLLNLASRHDTQQRSTLHVPRSTDPEGEISYTGTDDFEGTIRLTVSTRELISAGLMTDFSAEVETWDLLCACILDLSDTSGEGCSGRLEDESNWNNGISLRRIYVAAYPMSSSSTNTSSPYAGTFNTPLNKDGESVRMQLHGKPPPDDSMEISLRAIKRLGTFAAGAYTRIRANEELDRRRRQDAENRQLVDAMKPVTYIDSEKANIASHVHADSHEQFSRIRKPLKVQHVSTSDQLRYERVTEDSRIYDKEKKEGNFSDGLLFYRKAIAFLRLKNLNKERKCVRFSELKTDLKSCNARLRYMEQRMGDVLVMIKGLNGTATGVSTGPSSLWARACPVIMGVLSGYVALKNCSLCLISLEGGVMESAVTRGRRRVSSIDVREEGSVTVLSVKELSTPVKSVYDSDDSRCSYAESSDIGCTKGLVRVQSESVLEPAVCTLVRDLLCNSTSGRQLYIIVDSHIVEDEEEGKSCPPFSGDETWLVPVRTARAVLAVLKVTVKSSAKNDAREDLSPSRSFSRVSFSPDKITSGFTGGKESGTDYFCNAETRGRDRTAAARDALITFSNLLAPLLSTARQREMEQESASLERTTMIQNRLMEQKKAEREQELKQESESAPELIHASNNLASFNRFLSACLTLACSSSSSSGGGGDSSNKNDCGLDGGDRIVQGDSATTGLHRYRGVTTGVEAAAGMSAESDGTTPALSSPSPIMSSAFTQRPLGDEDLLTQVLRSIPDMVDKKVSCRLGVLSSYCNHPVFTRSVSPHGLLSSNKGSGQNDGNTIKNNEEKDLRKTEFSRFKWYPEPLPASISNGAPDAGCHGSVTDDLFAVLSRHGSRTADTHVAICSMTGLRSHQDVMVPSVESSDTQRTHTTLRIFSFPLLGTFPGNIPGPSDTLGVFQIALNVLGGDDINSTVLLEVFDQIAAALSCNLQLIMNMKSIHDNSEKIMLDSQHVRDKFVILLEAKKLWQARSAMWESVSESAMVMLSGAVKGGAVTFSEALSLAQGNQLVIQKELDVSHHAIQPTTSNEVTKAVDTVEANKRKKIADRTKGSRKETAIKNSGVEKNRREKRSENYPLSDACKRKNEEREERYRDPRVRAVRALQNIISNVEVLHDINRGASAADSVVNNA